MINLSWRQYAFLKAVSNGVRVVRNRKFFNMVDNRTAFSAINRRWVTINNDGYPSITKEGFSVLYFYEKTIPMRNKAKELSPSLRRVLYGGGTGRRSNSQLNWRRSLSEKTKGTDREAKNTGRAKVSYR
jgi:hypothetical protein